MFFAERNVFFTFATAKVVAPTTGKGVKFVFFRVKFVLCGKERFHPAF